MKSSKLNLTEGRLFFNITSFVVPIILARLIQTLYGIADKIIVGKFSGDEYALGATGAAEPATGLTISIFVGLSLGAGILVAQGIGSGNRAEVKKSVHTAMLTGLLSGILFMIIGLVFSRQIFEIFKINPSFIDKATLYFRIICFGIPAVSIANFASSILNSSGDSKSPLCVYSLSGLVNVLLNILV